MKIPPEIQELLWDQVRQYNNRNFVADDPISIPHRFSQKQDIEISAFFAATLAWGQRVTIINSTNKLMDIFENAPFDFITNVTENELDAEAETETEARTLFEAALDAELKLVADTSPPHPTIRNEHTIIARKKDIIL